VLHFRFVAEFPDNLSKPDGVFGFQNILSGEVNMKKIRQQIQKTITAITMCALIAVGLGSTFSATAATQKKSAKPAPKTTAKPLTPATPYDKGYQGGYSAGYTQGTTDWGQGVPHDYKRSDAYQNRERQYDQTLGNLEEYRQGHELGFELGYLDGYYGRVRNGVVPANGAVLAKAAALADAQRAREREARAANRDRERDSRDSRDGRDSRDNRDNRDSRGGRDSRRDSTPAGEVSVNLPNDTQLRLSLTSAITTKTARVGDRFTAKVVTPAEYEGATVEGHIATFNKSGRVSGKTELGLAFDSITFEDGRKARLEAQLERIVESESVKKVDEEGTIESGNRTKDSQVRGGVGAAAGAVIGGIAGGVKGALLGLILGGAAGVGTVAIEGNKDLVLEPGTEMIIRVIRSNTR
jgi:hypothetical protein